MAVTGVLIVMMIAFMVGAIIGDYCDARADEREAADMAEAERFIADLRAAFEYGDAIAAAQAVAA